LRFVTRALASLPSLCFPLCTQETVETPGADVYDTPASSHAGLGTNNPATPATPGGAYATPYTPYGGGGAHVGAYGSRASNVPTPAASSGYSTPAGGAAPGAPAFRIRASSCVGHVPNDRLAVVCHVSIGSVAVAVMPAGAVTAGLEVYDRTGRLAVVRGPTTDGGFVIRLSDAGVDATVRLEELSPVPPNKGDQAKVLAGSRQGQLVQVIGFDNNDALVCIVDANGVINEDDPWVLRLDKLCKVASPVV